MKIAQNMIFAFRFSLFAFIFFLLSIFYFLSSAAPTYAATQTVPAQVNNYPAPNTNPDVQNNLHNWTQTVMIEVMSSLTCQIAGVDPINPKQSCLGADSTTGKIGFLPSPQKGGAIGFMGNMIATLYTPPLHTADYFQNLAQNFGISKKTYAQTTGTGFDGLKPLLNLWAAFRNIVYLFLVVIFVVIGLAIMLRVKIDPRTVMTIQNQIPKIIVGILAVTFSFAIAGFLIDMMWVLIYLIYGIISPHITSSLGNLTPSNFQDSPFGVLGAGNIWSAIFEPSKGIGGLIASLLSSNQTLNMIINTIFGGPFGPILGTLTALGPLAQFNLFGGLLGLVGGFIAIIIIGIAVLVALFRLWFTLLKAYIYILLDVVLAPFWIIGGIVPGSPISLSGWLKDISANLLAFPVTIAMFMLGKVFMDAFNNHPADLFIPPLIGNSAGPSLIGSLINLGILLMTPNIVTMLKQAVKAPKMDTGIGKSLTPGLATPGRVVGGSLSTAFAPHMATDPNTGQTVLTYPHGTLGRFLRGFGFARG